MKQSTGLLRVNLTKAGNNNTTEKTRTSEAIRDSWCHASTLMEKMLDRILESMNKRFDMLEEKLETLTNNQTALTNREEEMEQQGSDHEHTSS